MAKGAEAKLALWWAGYMVEKKRLSQLSLDFLPQATALCIQDLQEVGEFLHQQGLYVQLLILFLGQIILVHLSQE